MSKHTPTPWEFHKDDAYYIRPQGQAMGPFADPICMIETGYVLPDKQKANAAFIVRAVNSHEAYTRLKEEMMDRIENKEGFDPHELQAWLKIIKQAEGK